MYKIQALPNIKKRYNLEEKGTFMMNYAHLVESIQRLSYEEKGDLEEMLHQMRIDERRREIRKNAKASRKEYEEGKVNFSSDLNTLKGMLND